jgi:nicotinamide-nucleotide amidase
MSNSGNALTIISENLTRKGETLAVAESVSSGLMMARISLAKNATAFFQGGTVAYNLGQKARHLQIDPIHATSVNCVSESVAGQMALGVAHSFSATWGIGVTGYAAPVPELSIETCFAFFAFCYRGKVIIQQRIDTQEKVQAQVQEIFIGKILEAFASRITLL